MGNAPETHPVTITHFAVNPFDLCKLIIRITSSSSPNNSGCVITNINSSRSRSTVSTTEETATARPLISSHSVIPGGHKISIKSGMIFPAHIESFCFKSLNLSINSAVYVGIEAPSTHKESKKSKRCISDSPFAANNLSYGFTLLFDGLSTHNHALKAALSRGFVKRVNKQKPSFALGFSKDSSAKK